MKQISVNGYRAEVLNEERTASIHFDGKVTSQSIGAPVGRITTSWLNAAKKLAEQAGADEIMVYHYRYITYDLRCVMKRTSGEYSTIIRYRRNENGVWYSVRETKSGLC